MGCVCSPSCLPPGPSGPFLPTQAWTALLFQGPPSQLLCDQNLRIVGGSQSNAQTSWMVPTPVLEQSRGRTWGK